MNDGKNFESYVQYVYQSLLNLRDEGVVVSKRAKLRGKSGAMHEVDVYYEFVRAGIRHRVAVECKDSATPAAKGDVTEFHGKVQDIGGINALVVSRNGFQEGARTYAKHWDIMLMSGDELPTLAVLLGKRLQAVALPDETCTGEPFWTIMALEEGRNSGTYFAATGPDGIKRVPLLFSKTHAEQLFQQAKLDPQSWGVRGIPRHVLRVLVLMADLFMDRGGYGFAICFQAPGADVNAPFDAFPITRDKLSRDYYGEELSKLKMASKPSV